MALTAPKDKQINFARQVAWERGQRLTTVPGTSSELSKVIEHLLAMPALPITDGQVEQIRQLNEQAVALVENYIPVAELPDGRDGANRLIFSLRQRISRVKFHSTDATQFLAPAGSSDAAPAAAAAETAVVSDDDAPF